MINSKLALKLFLIMGTIFCSGHSFAAQPFLTKTRIEADSIIKGLPLEQHKITKSGNGRTKQLWGITGQNYSQFEIIGNIQSDADQVGWSCKEYNAAGNYASPVRENSFCRKFFIKVLSNIMTQPETVANELLIKAEKIEPETAIQEFGDMSVETDGRFYFIRRISRMQT